MGISLDEAWVTAAQKGQTSAEWQVTRDGCEGRCWAGSLGLILRAVGTQGPCGERARLPFWRLVGGARCCSLRGLQIMSGQDTFPGATLTHSVFCESPKAGGGGLFPCMGGGRQQLSGRRRPGRRH